VTLLGDLQLEGVTECCYSDWIKENSLGGACSTSPFSLNYSSV